MSPTPAAEMHDLEASLQLRRQELVAQLRQRLHSGADPQELALCGNDTVDAGQAVASQLSDTEIGLLNQELAELQHVDTALARLRDHRYGRCSQCGGAIPAARLQALPEADLCLDCQRASETHTPGA